MPSQLNCSLSSDEHFHRTALSVEHQIYFNDFLMEQIIGNVHALQRENIELSSRRLYSLSIQTPCFIGEKWTLSLQQHHLEQKFGIKIVYKNASKQYKNKKWFSFENLENVLREYSKIFKRSFTSITFNNIMNSTMLEYLGFYFPYITRLECNGFDETAIEYLLNGGKQLANRITKFNLSDTYNSANLFTLFKNLKNICVVSYNQNIFEMVRNFGGKINKITVEKPKTSDDLMMFSQKCLHLKLVYEVEENNKMVESIFKIQNLHSLVIIFSSKLSRTFNFLKDCNFNIIRKLHIQCSDYNNKILEILKSKLSSAVALSELSIRLDQFEDDFYDTETDSDTDTDYRYNYDYDYFFDSDSDSSCFWMPFELEVSHILPQSLKKLELYNMSIRRGFKNISEKCPQLEYLLFTYDGLSSAISEKEIIPMLIELKQLRSLKTDMFFHNNVISTLTNSESQLRTIQFNMSPDNLKELPKDLIVEKNNYSLLGKYKISIPACTSSQELLTQNSQSLK